jgi:hypothetical protein
VLALLLLAAAALPGRAEDGRWEDIRITVESYEVRAEEGRTLLSCLATVENPTAVTCRHRFVVVGRDAEGRLLFTDRAGELELQRFEKLAVEITSELGPGVSDRLAGVKVLTESECLVAGIDTAGAGEAETRVRERSFADEQLRLWEERNVVLERLDAARGAGDERLVRFLEGELLDLEARIRDNDRWKRSER